MSKYSTGLVQTPEEHKKNPANVHIVQHSDASSDPPVSYRKPKQDMKSVSPIPAIVPKELILSGIDSVSELGHSI